MSNASLYQQLGGEAAVNAAVDIFYRKVLSDSESAIFLTTLTWRSRLPNRKPF